MGTERRQRSKKDPSEPPTAKSKKSGSSVADELIEELSKVNEAALVVSSTNQNIHSLDLAAARFRDAMLPGSYLAKHVRDFGTISRFIDSVTVPASEHQKVLDSFAEMTGITNAMRLALTPSWHGQLARVIELEKSIRKNFPDVKNFTWNDEGLVSSTRSALRDLGIGAAFTSSYSRMFASLADADLVGRSLVSAQRNAFLEDIGELSSTIEALRPKPIFERLSYLAPMEQFNSMRLLEVVDSGEEIEEPTAILLKTEVLSDLERELASVHPRFVTLWKGAKAAAARKGPDWTRHFAVSLRALATHLLHHFSPDARLKARTSESKVYENGRPTRATRFRYIFRDLEPALAPFFEADIKAAVKWIEFIHGPTHELEDNPPEIAVTAVMNRFEGLFLLIIRGARGFQ